MGVIESRATLGDVYIKGLNADLLDIQDQANKAYSLVFQSALGVENNTATQLFKVINSEMAKETIAGKTGVGYAQVTPEGADFHSDSRVGGYKTEYIPVTLTNGVTITLQDRLDRLTDSRLSEMKDILIGFKQTKNKHAFDAFNYGFTAQASLPDYLTYYGDGVPTFSTIHPLKASLTANTTQSNASAVGLPLSEINLETGRTALRRQTDEKDMPLSYGGGKSILLVPDSLEKLAVNITNSTKRQNTANNDMNIYDGIITVISTKWINSQNGGSDTAWFLIDSLNSPFMVVDRNPLTTSVYVTNSNKNTTSDAFERYHIGPKDFRGSWGSKGAGAAYAL